MRSEFDQLRYGNDDAIDLVALRRYRLDRVREQLRLHDYGGCVLADPLNIRYATDSTNMQVWVMHNAVRYVYIPLEGPVILFDFHNCEHLSADIETVNEVRPATGVFYFGAGPRLQEFAQRWAKEIADLVQQHGGGNRRLALDCAHHEAVFALQQQDITVTDAQEIMELARSIKSAEELACMRQSIKICQLAMQTMHEQARPGMTENEIWSHLHQVNIANGGEWIETRLLASGPRTNPWFKECATRVVKAGDIVSYDTDLVGSYGYCSDLSRSFVCGSKASSRQRELYSMSVDQINYNIDLLRPGLSFREFAERSYQLPERFLPNRYSVVAHGIGLCDEYPHIAYPKDQASHGYDGMLEAGMTLCVESYIGEENDREGVKLEQQVLIVENGVEQLSDFPFDEDLLGREV